MTEGKHLDNGGMEQVMPSRKKFLAGSAALLAGGALMAVPGVAKAHEQPDPPTDVDILNYALTLEHLEATFYLQGLKKFDNDDFKLFFLRNRRYERRGIRILDGEEVRKEFVRIREHEQAHVQTLKDVIRSLGGRPVPKASYNFERTAFTSVGKFVSVAQLLENTGVSAYDGAVAHIEAAKLLTAGATIATVEARHASYLNLINGDVPFPRAFDKPVAPRTICKTVNEAFITKAPKPYGPYASLGSFCNQLPNTVN